MNTQIIKKHIKLLLTFLTFSLTCTSFGQPPWCDTCTYNVDVTFNPKDVTPYVLTEPADTGEYTSCGTGVIIEKNISFIHGLGGSANSWAKQAVWTGDNYQTSKTVVNYDAKLQSSFNYITDNLIEPQIRAGSDQVTAAVPGRCEQNDFAIAHSQGGIAARYLDWKWDINDPDFGTRSFYGLVTFGTPHAGADIAITKSQHNAFIGQIASSVFLERPYGVVYNITTNWVSQTFLGLSGSDIQTKIDDAIVNTLAPLSTGSLHTPTLDEMKPNSPTMNSINNHHSRLRKVAFYGIEEEPECWRVISGITDTASEDYPIWGAKKDDHFQVKMEEAKADHELAVVANSLKIRNLQRGQVTSNVLIPFISLIWTKGMVGQMLELEDENKYRNNSINFLNNANSQWRELIGALHKDSLETKMINKYVLTWEEKYGFLGSWFSKDAIYYDYNKALSHYNTIPNSVYKTRDRVITTTTETRQVQKYFPNDGVVLERSQRAYPGVGNRQDKLEGDNHFQERNSPETERVMLKLYLGDYDDFFTTPK